MSDKLIDALNSLDIEANVNLDEDRTHITDVLIAFVQAADVCAEEGVMAGCAEPDCPDTQCTMRMKYDAARARLLAAITGEKE